jgi:hypothetical protein
MNTKNSFDLAFILLLFLISGLACNSFREPAPQQQANLSPAAQSPAAAPTPDDENAELKEKIEELEKKIEEQEKKSEAKPPVTAKPKVPTIKGTGGNAQVNSPNDGYLAMRSEPNTETGYRVLTIPHGADVRVLGCLEYSERVGGRTGRWCRVSYAGNTGWVFDGWLVYY